MRTGRFHFSLLLSLCALATMGCYDVSEKSAQSHPVRQASAPVADVAVTFVAGLGGKLEGNAAQTVPVGGDCTEVKAVPGAGYKFKDWTGEGFTPSTDNPLTVKNVQVALTLQANFVSKIATPADSAHKKHMALAKVECTACHAKSMPKVDFPANYNAKSGAASFDKKAGTCLNVSCHGGLVTPAWKTGKLDVNTQCTACHVSGNSQFNGYVGIHSPEHDMFLDNCTTCHDTAKLAAVHFENLQTPAMEGKAGLTIGGENNAYDVATTSCVTSCHNYYPLLWKKKVVGLK